MAASSDYYTRIANLCFLNFPQVPVELVTRGVSKIMVTCSEQAVKMKPIRVLAIGEISKPVAGTLTLKPLRNRYRLNLVASRRVAENASL
jgi:hypothetical protein